MSAQKKAQSLNEYAMIIGLVTLVFIGMQTYVKRGIQNIIKDTSDQLGEPAYQAYSSTLNANSQVLGSIETGLVNYTVVHPLDVTTQREYTSTAAASGASAEAIVYDTTSVFGQWKSVYKPAESVMFGASQKDKKLVESAKQQTGQ